MIRMMTRVIIIVVFMCKQCGCGGTVRSVLLTSVVCPGVSVCVCPSCPWCKSIIVVRAAMWMDVSDVFILGCGCVWVNFVFVRVRPFRVVRVDDVRTTNLVLRSDPAQGRPRCLRVFCFSLLFVLSTSLSLYVSLCLSPRLSSCLSLPVSLPV